MAARRRLRRNDNDFRVIQFTPPGLRVLGHLRQERHCGGARLRRRPVPYRSRHRGRPQRTARSRRRDQRSVPQRRRCTPAPTRPTCLAASGSAARTPSIAATARSPPSVIRTATAGYSRRSRLGCPAASTPRPRPSRPPTIWRAHCGAPRPPTESTKSASAQQMQTGRTGTPSTWCASRPAKSCRNKLLRGLDLPQRRLLALPHFVVGEG